MFYQKLNNTEYLLRLKRGEEAIKSLEKFCLQEQIDGAFFTGIGATDQVELAHYSVDAQKYSTKTMDQALEVTNLTGNVSTHEGQIIIHAHGTLSNPDMQAFGGHINRLIVSATLEILLHTTSSLSKTIDPETGLKLFDLPDKLL